MIDFNKGDRVKVEFEAKVTAASHAHQGREVETNDGRIYYLPDTALTLVEPQYERGAMYVDAEGSFFAYWPHIDVESPWFEPGIDDSCPKGAPVRPLTKLVREAS